MVVNVEMFLLLLFLLIGIIIIFNARFFVRNKVSKKFENLVVNVVKLVGLVICVISLIIIYYLK